MEKMDELMEKSETTRIKGNKIITVEAHRGLTNEDEEENTKEAFQKAIDSNIDGFETDCWLTRDKIIVLVHTGSNLSHQYNKSGDVRNKTWEELSTYRTKNKNRMMPRLDEVMKMTKNKINMNLEIKDPNEEIWPLIVNLIKENDYSNQIKISSFIHSYYDKVDEYNRENPDKTIPFAYLHIPFFHRNDFRKKNTCTYLSLYYTEINSNIIDQAHRNNIKVCAWFFEKKDNCLLSLIAENEEFIQRETRILIGMGCDCITTGFPKTAIYVRENVEMNSKNYESSDIVFHKIKNS